MFLLTFFSLNSVFCYNWTLKLLLNLLLIMFQFCKLTVYQLIRKYAIRTKKIVNILFDDGTVIVNYNYLIF